MMPVMNGAELIARIRRDPRTTALPIVMISASPGAEERSEPDIFFRKPFDPGVLADARQSFLRRRRGGAIDGAPDA